MFYWSRGLIFLVELKKNSWRKIRLDLDRFVHNFHSKIIFFYCRISCCPTKLKQLYGWQEYLQLSVVFSSFFQSLGECKSLIMKTLLSSLYKPLHCQNISQSYEFFEYIFIWRGNPYGFYQRALISNAATSALRLHQRLPHFQLSREFFGLLFLEDSCHYLMFSLIFMNGYPITSIL